MMQVSIVIEGENSNEKNFDGNKNSRTKLFNIRTLKKF